jgi:hypothetical protein
MKKTLYGILTCAVSGLAFAGPVDKPIDKILTDYFTIQSALARDTTTGIDSAASAIAQTATTIKADDPEVNTLVSDLQTAAREIQGKDLETARKNFFDLSRPLLVYLNKFHSDTASYSRFFCPMAKKGWIQPDKETRNPYYGSSMLACGQLIE